MALTTFWAMVTVGRVAVRLDPALVPTHRTYHVLPFVLAGARSSLIASLPEGSTAAGVAAFGLAGLGCSALLPLTISFAQEELVHMSAATAGLVIAAYQVGYGIAAFGAGPLQDAGVTLPAIFGREPLGDAGGQPAVALDQLGHAGAAELAEPRRRAGTPVRGGRPRATSRRRCARGRRRW